MDVFVLLDDDPEPFAPAAAGEPEPESLVVVLDEPESFAAPDDELSVAGEVLEEPPRESVR